MSRHGYRFWPECVVTSSSPLSEGKKKLYAISVESRTFRQRNVVHLLDRTLVFQTQRISNP